MNLVAAYFGHLVDWSQVDRDAYLDAAREAFRSNLDPLSALIGGQLRPISTFAEFRNHEYTYHP